ncbi:MAG: protein kinase, partial [Oscillospiraceae bacterium]|nr:protein kinase [Oscillospiraceae bacterium]
MKDKKDATECPFCGYRVGTPAEAPQLEPGTILLDRYLIGKALNQNGEGVSYISYDITQRKTIEIREFLPSSLCERELGQANVTVKAELKEVYRDYLADFLETARALVRLKEVASIVPVLDIFELNKTAYVVYRHYEGVTLFEAISHNKNSRIPWNDAAKIFKPVVSSIVAAHAIGLMHFGLSPHTILLTSDGSLKITGFGIPEAYLHETEIDAEPIDGFAAIEQYSIDGRKGKWTDVYGLSATLFFMVTGLTPPDAIKRSYDPSLNIPKDLAMSLPTHMVTAMA